MNPYLLQLRCLQVKLPIISGLQLVKLLCKHFGFEHKRTTGSHLVLIRTNPQKICVSVPNHDELAKGTLLSILNKADLSKEDLMKILSKK
ncbi:type II toxin-antitoxin system HicA family toxin [archaeon]|nr:type II toxin-antitoxin system HicA family toxin [archaeon]